MNSMSMLGVPGGAMKNAGAKIPPPVSAPERNASDSNVSSDDECAVASSQPRQQQRRHRHQEIAHEDRLHRHHRPDHSNEQESDRQQQRGRRTSTLSTRPATLEQQQLGAIELDMKKLERQRATLENLKLALDYGVVTQEEFVERARQVMEINVAPK